MVGYRAALALILGAAVAACATSPRPSQPQAAVPSGSAQITNVPAVPRPVAPPSGAPTPGPLTVEEAGAALIAVEGPLNRVWGAATERYSASAACAWDTTPCNETQMKAGKEYWAVVAAALDTYIVGLSAIRFPDVAASDAAAHIKGAVTLRDQALSASKATALDTFNASADAAANARDTFHSVQELKDALGLPVGP